MKKVLFVVCIFVLFVALIYSNIEYLKEIIKKGHALLKKNEFMEGSFYTGVFALFSGGLYYLGQMIKEAFVGRFLTTMNVNSNEEPFQWIIKYLGENPNFFYTAQKLTITEKILKQNTSWWRHDTNKEENTTVQLVPGTGLHIFQHEGKFFWLERVSNSELSVSGIFFLI